MKKAKVFISLLCAMALVLGSFPAMGFADEGDITVIVDGVTLDPAEGKAQIVGSGTTMVPFRAIFEALGFEVDYRESDGVVTSVMGYNIEENILIGLVVGENVIYMCTYSKYLDDIRALVSSPYSTMSEAVFIDETGRTLIPARAVSEALGAEVVWVAESKTVIITYATEHYYRATDIPRYEYVTGDAYTSVSYDAYRNPTYVYPYPESLDKFNYDYKRDALSDEGVVLIDQNADDISQQQTWLFESQANNYLLIRLDEYEELIYIT
ncbi:MAG: copper amine oxidase N-terminal domain-containing protein, partial [Clostridia bacterium]|nr:copper amine oxidase N-terminal domain-containing protein [Clostridia bacterium]